MSRKSPTGLVRYVRGSKPHMEFIKAKIRLIECEIGLGNNESEDYMNELKDYLVELENEKKNKNGKGK